MTDTAARTTVKLSENPDIPILEGWVTLTEAAERIGITRQHSYKRAQNGGYHSLHRVGNSSITVVSVQELAEINERKANRAPEKTSE